MWVAEGISCELTGKLQLVEEPQTKGHIALDILAVKLQELRTVLDNNPAFRQNTTCNYQHSELNGKYATSPTTNRPPRLFGFPKTLMSFRPASAVRERKEAEGGDQACKLKIKVERPHFLFMFRCCPGCLLQGQCGWC